VNKKYFAYIRVSTKKQGERGVSLQEQKDAIESYAAHKGLPVCRWFIGKETASKIGRPVFNEMLSLLKKNEADGVIVHKVDRSARNLHDWAEIGQLVEIGIDIQFATESLDLTTPGGRLSADMQAVMAVYYSRNLREEVKKGFYGRLKQGLFPKPAPLGYLNHGEGKPKTIDPKKGPLVRKAFELYVTGQYSVDQLVEKMYDLGLRSRKGNKVGRNSMSVLLSNHFYISEIIIVKTGQRFLGIHEPLIRSSLFERVQEIMTGRYSRMVKVHDFDFRRLLVCASCGHCLVGEIQKGTIYYRCHTKNCLTKTIRQEAVESPLYKAFKSLQFHEDEKDFFAEQLQEMKINWAESKQNFANVLKADLEKAKLQSERLLEAYLDGAVEKEVFEQKKTALAIKCREVEGQLRNIEEETDTRLRSLGEFLELAGNAYLLYKKAKKEKKRELVENLTSNRLVEGKKVDIYLSSAAFEFSQRAKNPNGGPNMVTARGHSKLLLRLMELLSASQPTLRFEDKAA